MPEQMLAKSAAAICSTEQERLDAEVARRLMGYRWVAWNREALSGAPLYEPGRFLAREDDMSSHLHVEAGPDVPLQARPLKHVPHYSGSEELAFQVASAASLFLDGKAVLFREADRHWVVEVRGATLRSGDLPELLCRAALRWLDAEDERRA